MALFLTRTRGRSARPTRRFGRLSTGPSRRRQPESGPTPISLVTPVANGTHHERPEPQLRWTDAHHVPPGDFCASAIANAALTPGVVPERGDAWETVSEFARSYDGYAYWDDLPELASRVLQGWTRDHTLPDSLDELRGCLFYEHRRWHHFGQDPAGRSAAYIWALADAVAEVVGEEDDSVGGGLVDPRPRRAPEAHVRILPAASEGRDLVSLGARGVVAPPAPAGQPAALRLIATPEPPAAAGAHVRLVSAIEAESGVAAAVASRHPSVWRGGEERATASVHELRPMPSADPLPKPSVIEPRPHPAPATSARTGATNGHAGNGRDTNGHRENGHGVIRAFSGDGADFRAWMEAHPQGFVLNRPGSARAKAMTLHRVGCPVLAGHAMAGAPSGGLAGHASSDEDRDSHPKVCGLSAVALAAWSRAQGVGEPVPCRRCHP